ncbi:hypothetical protein GH866_29980 [Bacillus thuringiensis]|nr:hypothetical protein [Bacillus thuringiensis]
MKSLTLVQSLDSKNELNVNIRKPLKGHRSPYLLDWEGNPVMFNKSYYLDPYAYLRRGLAYETYLGEEFVLLQNEGSTGYGQPIKFTRFIEDHTSECINIGDWVIIKAVYPSGEIDKDYFTYSQTPFVPGVKLSGLPIVPHHPDESQIWIPEILPEELPEDINSAPDLLNFFTIKNKYTRGYLSYEITPGKSWLNAKTDNIQKETLWRLIPE